LSKSQKHLKIKMLRTRKAIIWRQTYKGSNHLKPHNSQIDLTNILYGGKCAQPGQ